MIGWLLVGSLDSLASISCEKLKLRIRFLCLQFFKYINFIIYNFKSIFLKIKYAKTISFNFLFKFLKVEKLLSVVSPIFIFPSYIDKRN